MHLGLRRCGGEGNPKACSQQKSREGLPQCNQPFQSETPQLETEPHSTLHFLKGWGTWLWESVTVAAIVKQLRLFVSCRSKEAEYFLW